MQEADIRPKELFNHYLELSRQDAQSFNRQRFESIPCPACGKAETSSAFEKFGFHYLRCATCGSLYCSPRPSEAVLMEFYKNSPSSTYWSQVFFPQVAESRREKLFKPKAAEIAKGLKQRGFEPKTICDVGAGYGMLLEELRPYFPAAELYAIEPSAELAARCRSQGFVALETTVEHAAEWQGKFDLVICFEVIEHVYQPLHFVGSLKNLLREEGLCLITGLGCDGFDIVTLKQHSQSVSPPHHLNFPSISGYQQLFERAGMKHIEITTPGQLDVDIVLNSGHSTEFLKMLESRGKEAVMDFQALLQKHRLSSHTWVMAQKA